MQSRLEISALYLVLAYVEMGSVSAQDRAAPEDRYASPEAPCAATELRRPQAIDVQGFRNLFEDLAHVRILDAKCRRGKPGAPGSRPRHQL